MDELKQQKHEWVAMSLWVFLRSRILEKALGRKILARYNEIPSENISTL